MTTTRLIERWLPIAEIGIESVRERTPMTPFPAPNRLHVWWARRPLVASRAAVLASILPADADRASFKHAIGIHGDPVRGVALIERARRTGVRVDNPYGYDRAYKHAPTQKELAELLGETRSTTTILDATAGGGAIPLEAIRLGFSAIANDLNPVASLIQKATIEYPRAFGKALSQEFDDLSKLFRHEVSVELGDYIPQPNAPDEIATSFIWARTVRCPYCSGAVPLSPSWRLAADGTGLRILPRFETGPGDETRRCDFEIVVDAHEQSSGTVAAGEGLCPYSDCGRAIAGDEIKRQAQSGEMGDQLCAVVVRRRVVTKTKSGKNSIKWLKGYRVPGPQDDNTAEIADRLSAKMVEWEALNIVPNENIPDESNYDRGHKLYGIDTWQKMFSPRQILSHGTGVEVFQRLLSEDRAAGRLTDVRTAAYVYLALAIDKMVDYNARLSYWDINVESVRHVFGRHDFSFMWAYAEMASLVEGLGLDWALQATGKALAELIAMVGDGKHGDMLDAMRSDDVELKIINGPGASMSGVADKSVAAIVMDPPYGANVMYAELSDFF
jgi:adenine-specific DNA methylase